MFISTYYNQYCLPIRALHTELMKEVVSLFQHQRLLGLKDDIICPHLLPVLMFNKCMEDSECSSRFKLYQEE